MQRATEAAATTRRCRCSCRPSSLRHAAGAARRAPRRRTAEVAPLAQGLLELMDEDRDDAIAFPDFLRVRFVVQLT